MDWQQIPPPLVEGDEDEDEEEDDFDEEMWDEMCNAAGDGDVAKVSRLPPPPPDPRASTVLTQPGTFARWQGD